MRNNELTRSMIQEKDEISIINQQPQSRHVFSGAGEARKVFSGAENRPIFSGGPVNPTINRGSFEFHKPNDYKAFLAKFN